MPYVANKNRMNLGGRLFRKGEQVPDDEFEKIPQNRQRALVRTRLIMEVELDQVPPQDEFQEGICARCGEGPFKRLEQHITMKHELASSDDSDEDDDSSEEE